jgi:hypothetical protein
MTERQFRELEIEALGEEWARGAQRIKRLSDALFDLVEHDGAEFARWWVELVMRDPTLQPPPKRKTEGTA